MTPPEGRRNTADILVIGAQRAMTTWLHQVLSAHPGTWAFPDFSPLTSTNKEAQFWTRNHHRGPDWYRVLMTPPEGRARLSMDFTPDYARLPDAQIAECKALSPTAKVIYILRDPLARAVSALRMHLLWEHGRDWAGVLDLGPDLYRLATKARLAAHGDYLTNLGRWRQAYPDLIVLNYEDFHTDRAARVEGVMAALDLDPAEITGAAAERRARLMSARVWASEPFRVSRPALMFLHGLTRAWRAEAEAALGWRWTEGARLLAGG